MSQPSSVTKDSGSSRPGHFWRQMMPCSQKMLNLRWKVSCCCAWQPPRVELAPAPAPAAARVVVAFRVVVGSLAAVAPAVAVRVAVPLAVLALFALVLAPPLALVLAIRPLSVFPALSGLNCCQREASCVVGIMKKSRCTMMWKFAALQIGEQITSSKFLGECT